MIEKWTDLSEILAYKHIHSSTPTRLHCGGSTDHRLTALLCRAWQPVTANIAIELRAHVRLRPYTNGKVAIDIQGVGKREFTAPALPLTGPFALVSAVVCYFGVHGLHIGIKTDFPYQSGLGGSGAVAVALIGAIYTALNEELPSVEHFPSMVNVAHNLEDSLFRNTGMQDQAAAIYGGVNLWEWKYADRLDFTRQPIMTDVSVFHDHILLAYTGRPHETTQNGSQMVARFKDTGAIKVLVSISEQARAFAALIERREFRSAGRALAAEYNLRSTLLPVTSPDDLALIEMALVSNCGASITGHSGGGCIWALGEKGDIAVLRKRWTRSFEQRGTGFILPVSVAAAGLQIARTPSQPAVVSMISSIRSIE